MKILLTLSDDQVALLDALMAEDTAHNRSAWVALLISGESKRRKFEREKRGAGRPPKGSEPVEPAEDVPDYSDDEPKNIPHFGRMIGRREYQDIEAAAQAFRAQL